MPNINKLWMPSMDMPANCNSCQLVPVTLLAMSADFREDQRFKKVHRVLTTEFVKQKLEQSKQAETPPSFIIQC